MKSKGVAIPYVIALVLGVIIIGLLGYWFVTQGGKTIGSGEKAECSAKQVTFCQSWRNTGFNIKPFGFSWDSSCEEPSEGNHDQCRIMLQCDFVPKTNNCLSGKREYGIIEEFDNKVCCS